MDMKTNPRFMFVLLFVCLFLETNLSLRVDTISANQSLSGHQTIVSAGGVFELGFFKPGNSPNYYIGMWWKKVTVQTVVWVANREKPVLDRFSSELKISNGNLVLFNGSKVPIWSTNVNSTRSASLEAVLLDNGNLVLKHVGKQMKPIWESFYHLTDSLLPGCKFGYNKKTKRKQVLTAWKNLEDPAPGRYSIEPFPRDNSFVIEWNMSRGFWNTGTWNGEIFNLVPGVNIHSLYNFSYVSNDKESYFIYFVENTTKTISRLVMGISGQLQQPLWMPPEGWRTIWSFPRQQCKVHAFCGPYGSCTDSANVCSCLTGFKQKSPSDSDLKDYSGGCIRKTKLQCENYNISSGEKDKFLELPDMLLHESEQFVKVGDITACESTCLNNCSCVAFAYDNKHGCSIWTNDLLDLEQLKAGDNNGRTLYLRLAASDYWDAMNSKRLIRSASNKALIIGVVVGSSVVLLAGLVIFSVIRQRNKKIRRRQKAVQNSLTVFTYKELQNATKNFSEKLGGGGFGSVFKGTLPHSSMVAVKKLESVGQGEKQFRAEISTIGTIQHVNLVRLRGFSSEGTKKLLVYDYMQNGSLASHLFHEKNPKVLDWKARYQIALGTAKGLVYLHEMCRNCIIHCDIKPENILLDAEFCPKVADFGLAKLVGREFSRVLTTMRGTRGYLAPEWIGGLAITPKADVYSYGMMLFELVSGKRNSKQSDSEGKVPKYFPSLATSVVVEGGDVLSILDPRLEGDADVQELENVCKVACWCIQDEEAHRPTMSQVVQMLEGTLEVDLPPIPRTLYFFDEN